jgi:hypothetical protein
MKTEKLPTKKRKITIADIDEMAKLVAKRMTEREAALLLGITPQSWYQFRSRNKSSAKFEQSLTRARGAFIAANLREMEKAAGGKDGVRHDWRAADRLNQIAAPDRFAPQPPPPPPPPVVPQVTISMWLDEATKRSREAPREVKDTWTPLLLGEGKPAKPAV